MGLATYSLAFTLYPYSRVPAQDAAPVRHPVVIVGGGPVGLATALDLGRKGTPVLLLDDHEGAGLGSRAICFSKRTLEIADRLGTGQQMREKGIVWNTGRVFHGERQLFEFDLLPEEGHANPAFVNLQQPYVEKFLTDSIRQAQADGAPIEIRGRNAVTALELAPDHTVLDIETPDGAYQLEADWVVACDGAKSPLRSMLDLGFEGRVFMDNFLIADVRMTSDLPTERHFWFEPSSKTSGQSALLHRQPDNIWRLDFQLGWEIDRAQELTSDNVRRRVDAMLGPDVDYEIEWSSIYTFQCRRMANFRCGRVLFAGDSAHQVSPFGARGANSGIQDADNLAWKLHLVVSDTAPERLLDSYCHERESAADENILNSTRSTDFITPKSDVSRLFRNAVLSLANDYPFARPLVNSGRLSTPSTYDTSPLNSPDMLHGPRDTRPGAPAKDAPCGNGFLLAGLSGCFTLLALNTQAPEVKGAPVPMEVLCVDTHKDDPSGALAARYLGNAPQALYLIRPDQHVAARWADCTGEDVQAALAQCLGRAA